jgi:Uma2 family endonuclease
LETNRHRIAMNVLIDSALQALSGRPDCFTGGNMFVYYSRNQAMNRDFRGPDFFVALDVEGDRPIYQSIYQSILYHTQYPWV